MAERFGRYWLQEKIGHGGMAEIFRATIGPDPETYVFDLAIKRMHAGLERDRSQVDMFLTEADIAKLLRHPNLVRVYEAGLVEGRAFIAMEFVWGHDLAKIIDTLRNRSMTFTPELAVFTTLALLRGLDYVHRAQSNTGAAMELVHRDVTPSNVYVTYNGEVKLGDFGVATVGLLETHDDKALVRGKVAYLPPETIEGAPVGQGVDLWGAAAILFEMLTGQLPYEGTSEEELLGGVPPPKVPAPHRLNPAVSPKLSNILSRALSHKQKKRPADALTFYRELKLYLRYSQSDVGSQTLARFVREIAGAAPATRRREGQPGANDFALPEYQVPVGRSPTQRFEAIQRKKRMSWLPLGLGATLVLGGVAVGWYVLRPRTSVKPVTPTAPITPSPPVVPQPSAPATPTPRPGVAALAAELAIADEAERFKALMRRGLIEQKNESLVVAVAAYEAALTLKPTFVPARLAAAKSLLSLKRHADAEAHVNLALEAQPKNVGAFLLLGDILKDRGDAEQARWAYKRCVSLDPVGKLGKAAKKALDAL
jgi:eukaryotic-like serine/threonine-protein kinase